MIRPYFKAVNRELAAKMNVIRELKVVVNGIYTTEKKIVNRDFRCRECETETLNVNVNDRNIVIVNGDLRDGQVKRH